jgi:hypothetical protein
MILARGIDQTVTHSLATTYSGRFTPRFRRVLQFLKYFASAFFSFAIGLRGKYYQNKNATAHSLVCTSGTSLAELAQTLVCNQFRADFFNGWNHTQFSGLATDFVPLEYVAGSPADPNSSFGSVQGTRAPREIQLGLKFVW